MGEGKKIVVFDIDGTITHDKNAGAKVAVKETELIPRNGAVETINEYQKNGLDVHFVTVRHQFLKEKTIKQLKKVGIAATEHNVHTCGTFKTLFSDLAQEIAKWSVIKKILECNNGATFVAGYGDKFSDFLAYKRIAEEQAKKLEKEALKVVAKIVIFGDNIKNNIKQEISSNILTKVVSPNSKLELINSHFEK